MKEIQSIIYTTHTDICSALSLKQRWRKKRRADKANRVMMVMIALLTVLVTSTAVILFRSYLRDESVRRAASKITKDRNQSIALARSAIIAKIVAEEHDVLIIGGGATGVGCALDASTRGLKTALIEASDFGAETSSKSTKLLHGGIRYLEKAVRRLSLAQFLLVFEALRERWTIMHMAPFLSQTVQIMIPLYTKTHILYYWILLKVYEKISGLRSLGRSSFISAREAAEHYGRLATNGLQGAVVYKDGSFDDSRMNVLMAATAAAHGAVMLNHCVLKKFIRESGENERDRKLVGAVCYDTLACKEIVLRAKCFISAAGPYTDTIRSKRDATNTAKIMVSSRGTHLLFPPHFCPFRMGLVDSNTSDRRVLFILPWKGHTLVGSTEVLQDGPRRPVPSTDEIAFICSELQKYTTLDVQKKYITGMWSGIRPLLRDPGKPRTEEIVRGHRVIREEDNFVVVTGGKWTTFRRMARETIDAILSAGTIRARFPCVTEHITLLGSENYSEDLFFEIEEILNVSRTYAMHLLRSYGSRAFLLKKYLEKYPEPLSEKYPFRAAEVAYCIDHELAATISDVVNGRFMVGYFNVIEAEKMVEGVKRVMSGILKWDSETEKKRMKDAMEDLENLGLSRIKSYRKND